MQRLYRTASRLLATVILSLLIQSLLTVPTSLAQDVRIFFDDFENGSTPNPEWTFTPAVDGGVAEITNMIQGITTNPNSGEFFAAVLGRSSDGTAVTNTMDLALDLSGETEVEMTFDMQNLGDDTQEVGEQRSMASSSVTMGGKALRRSFRFDLRGGAAIFTTSRLQWMSTGWQRQTA